MKPSIAVLAAVVTCVSTQTETAERLDRVHVKIDADIVVHPSSPTLPPYPKGGPWVRGLVKHPGGVLCALVQLEEYVLKVSSDNGKTWAQHPIRLPDAPEGQVPSSLSVTRDGRLWILHQRHRKHTELFVSRSANIGKTWETTRVDFGKFSPGGASDPYVTAHLYAPSFLELDDGTLAFSCSMRYADWEDWQQKDQTRPGLRETMVRSKDAGNTWGDPLVVHQHCAETQYAVDPRNPRRVLAATRIQRGALPGEDAEAIKKRTGVPYPPGNPWCYKNGLLLESTDGGRSFQEVPNSRTDFGEYRWGIVWTSDNVLILTGSHGSSTVARVSLDGGRQWVDGTPAGTTAFNKAKKFPLVPKTPDGDYSASTSRPVELSHNRYLTLYTYKGPRSLQGRIWQLQDLPPSTGTRYRSEAKRARLGAARRQRRVIFVDDNYGLAHQVCDTPKGFLEPRLKPLIGSQVDTITYCVYAHSPTYVSHLRPKIYDAHGGSSTSDKQWTLNHKALLAAGHDPLQLAIDFAHDNGLEIFAHMSMNDCHDSFMDGLMHPWKKAHPELRVDTTGTLSDLRLYVSAYDFSHEEVRDRQFSIIEEICQRYDIDGFEMDYIRHPMFFSRCMRGEPATQTEVGIMTAFMARIRSCADAAGARRGRPLLLSARVPDSFQRALHVGLDLEAWMSDDLIDLVIAGGGYAPSTLSVADFVKVAHQHAVLVYPCINQKPWSCEDQWRLEGNRALAATWHRAGADGIHLWNLATPFDAPLVRSHQELIDKRKHCYACLTDIGEPETLVGKDKVYCVDSSVFKYYRHVSNEPPLPVRLIPGTAHKVPMVLADDIEAASRAGTLAELRLELTFEGPVDKDRVALHVNRQPVMGGKLVLRDAQYLMTCSLASTQLEIGQNEIEVSVRQGPQGDSKPIELVKAQLWVKYQ